MIISPATLNPDLWLEAAARSTNITIGDAPATRSISAVPLGLGLSNSGWEI